MEPGVLFSSAVGVVVALLGVLSAVAVRRTREATTMKDAWDRIDLLTRDVDANRRALRITEEGMDALWRWSQRVMEDWGTTAVPPAFTPSEERSIGRARKAVELTTGPIPKVGVNA